MNFRELLASEFAPYGELSGDQHAQLEEHYRLLVRWNEKINLTRIRRLEDVVRLHYCESLFLGRTLPAGSLQIADIGSGAGFPGVPVAVFRPECTVDLIESHQRKAAFLREASRDLPNVRVLVQRAETCESHYDWIISRAVRPVELVNLNLAPNVALLTGREDASWLNGESLDVPWGNKRVLRVFHVEHSRKPSVTRDKI